MHKIRRFVIGIFLLLSPCYQFAQTPDLGTAANFVLFSKTGAIGNTGISHITGNVGTNTGAISSFGNINGVMHFPGVATALAAIDLQNVYSQLNSAVPTAFPGASLGDGATLPAGVFSIPEAAVINNILILDGKGNENAVFIFQVEGAFSSGANTEIKLINCARAANVFWKVEGAVHLAAGTIMKGTIIANNAAISLGAGVHLEGRALSTTGAIAVNNVLAYLPPDKGSPLLTGPVPPILASTACYTLFSSYGLVTNVGATTVSGNIGSDFGGVSGFNPLLVNGTIHTVPDGSTLAGNSELLSAYNYLNALPHDIELLYPAQFGNSLVLTPHTYLMYGAVVFTDTLFLNAQGNPNAVFVIKAMGPIVTSVNSQVVLLNGAQARNVYWQVEGAVTINNHSVFKGTIVCNNAAIVLNTGTQLEGRAFTTNGAITSTAITASAVPAASISYAGYTYCSNAGIASVNFSGTSGGVYSSTTGLVINPATGDVNLELSTPGSYVVNYSIIASGECLASSTNASISIALMPSATISYPGSPFCSNVGIANVAFSGNPSGTYSALPAGLSINALSGAVDLATSIPGSYTITYTIVTCSGGCGSSNYTVSVPFELNLFTWTGAISSDWNTAANWEGNIVPTIGCPDVTIPSGTLYEPILGAGIATIQSLIIQPGAILTLTGGTLKLSGSINNSGTLAASKGSIELNGTAGQTVPADKFLNNAVNHLIINNSSAAGITLAGPLDIYGSLTYLGTGKKLTTNNYLTLKSNATNTAWVGDMTGNTITGNVTVERYNSKHKAWRFLSIPTNTTQTIRESWQEGGTSNTDNPKPGFGVQLTGAGGLPAGFDLYTGSPSMKIYNPETGNWVGVANTTTKNIKSTGGYQVLIRGNRSSNAFNSPVTESVLRTNGPLYTGSIGPISVIPDKFASIGNPYASSIDFTKINRTLGIDNKFYLWDPLISGALNLGGYQTFSSTNNWEPVPGGSATYPTGMPNTTIQSGQAFFIHATKLEDFLPGNYEVTFNESSKIAGSGLSSFSRPQGGSRPRSDRKFFRASLFTGPTAADVIADGNAVAFDENYSNDIDGDDALKIAASGENFDVKRNTKLLAIEARKSIIDADTIYYNISNLAVKTYQLRFSPINMGSDNLQAFLLDNFLNTATSISLQDSTYVNITVTGVATSRVADRFKVIFKQMAVLPVTITTVKAKEETVNINVTWKVENESNMNQYVVEKSTDGIIFVQVGKVDSKNINTGEYRWLDKNKVNGINYYRIRSIDLNGKKSLTPVVKVLIRLSSKGSMSVYPNPLINGEINLQLSNLPPGKYGIRLINKVGQVMMIKQINLAEGSSSAKILMDKFIPKGFYEMEVTGPYGSITIINLMYLKL